MSFQIRRSEDRGHADHGWLKTRHTFSFADYHDPEWTGFKTLRVMNEDEIKPGKGFDLHGHRDMEILTYVMEGQVRHVDTQGNNEVLKAGEVQHMTAGTGIQHMELNASQSTVCHLYQIWIQPEENGLPPSYEQKPFWGHLAQQGKVIVASHDGRHDSLKIHQQAELWLHRLKKGESTTVSPPKDKAAWVQIVAGEARFADQDVQTGDGIAANEHLGIVAKTDLEMMEFIL